MNDLSGHNRYAIPGTINACIVLVSSVLYFGLLAIASNEEQWHWVLAIAVLFAVIMIPVYTLIHEAEHNIIHTNIFINNFLGRWLCCLFIAPYTFFKHCHHRHHKKNRTDIEIWELYFEHQVKWKRYGNLYVMMIGIGYWSVVLSVLLFAVAPKLVYSRFFMQHTETAGFLEGSNTKEKISASRTESLSVLLFHVACFFIFQFNLAAWLCCYVVHGFVWSSQNYVNHAFSPRDVINGAHNLKVPVWLKAVYLNFNLHLAHHQHPKIPWIHLPHFIKHGTHRTSFFRNYLRLWKGPVLTHEPDPVKAAGYHFIETE